MEKNQYMDMFLDESHEHLQSLNDGLLSLEENSEDISVVNEIFRNAHTLKGMSATMGFNKIAELTHEMEDVLDLIRKEQLKLTEDIVDTLFKCLDSLEQMVDNVGNGDPEDLIDVSDLVAKLSAISKGEAAPAPAAGAGAAPAAPAAPEAASAPAGADDLQLNDSDKNVLKQAKETGLQGMHVKVTLSDTCLLKSARSYMVMNALDELGDVVKTVPPAEDLEQEKFEHSFDILVVTASEPKAVEDALLSISEIDKILVEIVDPDKPAAPAAAAAAAPALHAGHPAAAGCRCACTGSSASSGSASSGSQEGCSQAGGCGSSKCSEEGSPEPECPC